MMPFIEFFGIFTKPFALMIRLFANMLAGHMAMLVLTCLIFISASMGPALNGTLTVASVLFNIFMNALELLVAFIQAYVFTMLSAVFIGLAQEEHKAGEKKRGENVIRLSGNININKNNHLKTESYVTICIIASCCGRCGS